LNNPLIFSDPSGHSECGPSCPDALTYFIFSRPLGPLATPPSIVEFVGFDESDSYQAALMQEIEAAALLVGERLREELNKLFPSLRLTAREAFLLVYGGKVTFTWTGERKDHGAFTESANSILVYDTRPTDTITKDDEGNDLPGAITNKRHWATHELGHAFSSALSGKPSDDTGTFLDMEGNEGVGRPRDGSGNENEYYGFGGPWKSPRKWQQSKYSNKYEQFADMFLGWVYGEWAPSFNPSFGSGQAMSNFMNDNMPIWLSNVYP